MRCLTVHADYRCQRSGACCTASWPIPVEADRLARLQSAVAAGTLRARTADPFEWPPNAPADSPAVLRIADHACVFFDRDGGQACRIHRSLGHEALPLACRQFPRISLRDPRGVSVTLSHYCPTASASLARDDRLRIVDGPPAFPENGEYDGLDVRAALPPLLRPDCLMDWESWWEWERLSVGVFARLPARDALEVLAGAVERVTAWRSGDGLLVTAVGRSFSSGWVGGPEGPPYDSAAAIQQAFDAIPDDLRPAAREWLSQQPRPAAPVDPRVESAFLAAHAFANWTAHLGRGLYAWLRSIQTAHALLEAGYGVSGADLILRHLADPSALARIWSLERRT